MRTEDYLVSLRKGDYVDILNWLNFLTEYYSAPNQPLEADTIIPLMSFELINHGFKKTDGNIIQKIYIILNNNMVASGQLQYALTLLVSAILQCQIYAEFNLLSFYQTTEKFNAKQIKSWMTREVKDDPKLKLTAAENSAALEEKYKKIENNSHSN